MKLSWSDLTLYSRAGSRQADLNRERWKEHGSPSLSEEVKALLVAGVEQELAGQDRETLAERRDDALVELYQLKQKFSF